MRNFTPQVLDILKAENVPAAFFLIGKNIQGNEDLVKRLVNEGHVIGNHSFEHGFWFSLQNKKKMAEDARKFERAICSLTGYLPKLYRPPYGVTNPMVAAMIKERGYHSIGWSVRTYDTKATSAQALLKKSLKNLSNGDVVLFHDWAPYTIGILSDFIHQSRKKGFEFVRVDELFNVEAYYVPKNEEEYA
jgi:peptidoglycan/xylan/chitin deacetylase (PgdA/CDA1 family)